MQKNQYQKITQFTARVINHVPGGARILSVPTLICGAIYLAMLTWLAWHRDVRLLKAAAVPAVSFLVVTVLRPIVNRQRPYDRFQVPPVGKWKPGKGRSMPSRHTVSAVSIAVAVMYVFPLPWVCICMMALGLLIALLRVFSGQHFPSDVAAAVLLAIVIAFIGYRI